MTKFPRRGASGSQVRTAVVVTVCVLLSVFAIRSKSDWLHKSDPSTQRPEGRSLRATDSSFPASASFFRQSALQPPVSHSVGDDVLVLYLYDNRDPVWVENFNFFLQWGVHYNDGCSYIVLVSEAMYAAKVGIAGLPLYDTLFCLCSSLHCVLSCCRKTYLTLPHFHPMHNTCQQTQQIVRLGWVCSVRLLVPAQLRPTSSSTMYS